MGVKTVLLTEGGQLVVGCEIAGNYYWFIFSYPQPTTNWPQVVNRLLNDPKSYYLVVEKMKKKLNQFFRKSISKKTGGGTKCT